MKKIIPIFLLILIFLAAYLIFDYGHLFERDTATPPELQVALEPNNPDAPAQTVIAQNLEVPWALAFLPASPAGGPDGSIIITERNGNIRIINKQGQITDPLIQISVRQVSESGLHGVTVDPDFATNKYVYFYYTYRSQGNNTLNRVARYILDGNKLTEDKIIVDGIPGASNHDGGRIKFGPDGFLYITTGDAQEPSSAQDKNSLAGKILRVTRDGAAASGNPFGTRVYSYGHRNPQGITWDDQNRLWSTEHGRSGVLSGLDELNLIEPGGNYGWPEIEGDEMRNGMITPVLNSGASDTWAPGDVTFADGALYFVGLRGSALYKYDIETQQITEYLKDTLGRLREVITGPDGLLYITTSNLDGRGNPQEGDDKIIRINPAKL